MRPLALLMLAVAGPAQSAPGFDEVNGVPDSVRVINIGQGNFPDRFEGSWQCHGGRSTTALSVTVTPPWEIPASRSLNYRGRLKVNKIQRNGRPIGEAALASVNAGAEALAVLKRATLICAGGTFDPLTLVGYGVMPRGHSCIYVVIQLQGQEVSRVTQYSEPLWNTERKPNC